MNFAGWIKRTLLGRTVSGSEGAKFVGTSTKANLGSATTVEAALASVNTFVGAISETIDDRTAALLVAGTSITLTYNDGAGTLTVAVASHTHTASQVTDFSEAVDDRVAALFVAGTNITLTYNDGAGTFTIDAAVGSHTQTASTITDFAEAVDDRVAALLVAGTSITLTYNDGAGTLTVDVASHTHTASQITDFSEAVDDRVAALFVAGTNITLTYNDGAGTFTIDAAGASGISAVVDDTSPDLGGNLNVGSYFIVDTNGNELIKFVVTASAVNEITVTNAATGNAPKIAATGGDTDINLELDAKGAGLIKFLNATFRDENAASDAATITFDLSISNIHTVTLGGNRTLALSNAANGAQIFAICLTQDGTGSRTVTWFSTIRWSGGGTPPTLTTTANKCDTFIFRRTGSGTYRGFVVGVNE